MMLLLLLLRKMRMKNNSLSWTRSSPGTTSEAGVLLHFVVLVADSPGASCLLVSGHANVPTSLQTWLCKSKWAFAPRETSPGAAVFGTGHGAERSNCKQGRGGGRAVARIRHLRLWPQLPVTFLLLPPTCLQSLF